MKVVEVGAMFFAAVAIDTARQELGILCQQMAWLQPLSSQ